jgi:hypothetical protein
MFFYGKEDLTGSAVCLFASTNVLLGVLGFYCCALLVKADRERMAHAVWTTAYTCMFAILSLGYDRFLYAGEKNAVVVCAKVTMPILGC